MFCPFERPHYYTALVPPYSDSETPKTTLLCSEWVILSCTMLRLSPTAKSASNIQFPNINVNCILQHLAFNTTLLIKNLKPISSMILDRDFRAKNICFLAIKMERKFWKIQRHTDISIIIVAQAGPKRVYRTHNSKHSKRRRQAK